MRTFILTIAISVAFAAVPFASDVDSGPKPGSPVPALTVQAVTGADAGKKLDLAAARKDKPTVFVFVQAAHWDRPVARYLKFLDRQISAVKEIDAVKDLAKDIAVVAVWLTDDAEKTREYLPKAAQSLRFEATALTYDPDNKDGPNAWALHERAFVTTVVSDGKKVCARFGHQSLNETNVPEVVAAVEKALEKK